MKICCVVPSLAGGGAERVMSILANEWALRGRYVTVVTLAPDADDAYRLDARVARVSLGLEIESRSPTHAVVYNIRKIRGLRDAVIRVAPNVVVSFIDKVNVLTLLSCLGLGIPV